MGWMKQRAVERDICDCCGKTVRIEQLYRARPCRTAVLIHSSEVRPWIAERRVQDLCTECARPGEE